MNLIRNIFIFILIIFSPKLYSCALCSVYDPTVYVGANINIFENRLENIHFKWEFSKLFLAQSITLYDDNKNGKLDLKEQEIMFKDFEEALRGLDYHLSLTMDVTPQVIDANTTKNATFSIKDEKLYFEFTLLVGRALKGDHVLQYRFVDDNGFFGFFNKEEWMKINSDASWQIAQDSNFYTNIATIHLINSKPTPQKIETIKDAPKDDSTMLWLANKLYDVLFLVQQKLEGVQKDGGFSAWLGLLLFSFLYGVAHAIGPGHGKSLVGAYFVSQDRSFSHAWGYAGLIGVVHVLSAFILTLIAYTLTQMVANKLADDAQNMANAIAGAIMVLIAILLIYQKLGKPAHEHTCGCGSCKSSHKSDIGVIISAGAVPCPGTVLVFMTIFTVGAFWAGLLSAIAMSAGMAVVIGLSASFGIGLRHTLKSRFQSIMRLSELFALAIILFLGIIMVLGAFS